jgi:predicted kinase
MKLLILIRGLPGSGKSTLAHKLSNVVFEADDFFMNKNPTRPGYVFNPQWIETAHKDCFNRTKQSMENGEDTICVSNTFSRYWEYANYLELAQEMGYEVQVIHCTGPWKNIHGCPDSTIDMMRRRMEPSFLNEEEYHQWLFKHDTATMSDEELKRAR